MITPEFLQSCTDEHINKGVAWLEVSKFSLLTKGEQNEYEYKLARILMMLPRSYCTNPNDAWPIIVENEMLIRPVFDDSGYWMAQMYQTQTHSKNPLRAAMEVYILMSVKL